MNLPTLVAHVRSSRALNLKVTSQETEGNASCIEDDMAKHVDEGDVITAASNPLNSLIAMKPTADVSGGDLLSDISQPRTSPVTQGDSLHTAPTTTPSLQDQAAVSSTCETGRQGLNGPEFETETAEWNDTQAASKALPSNQSSETEAGTDPAVSDTAEGPNPESEPPTVRQSDPIVEEGMRSAPGGPNEPIEWAFLRMNSEITHFALENRVQIDPALVGEGTQTQPSSQPLSPHAPSQPSNAPIAQINMSRLDYTLPPSSNNTLKAAPNPPAKRGRPKKSAQGVPEIQPNLPRSTRSTANRLLTISDPPNISRKSGRRNEGDVTVGGHSTGLPGKTSRKRAATSDTENVNAKPKRKWKG